MKFLIFPKNIDWTRLWFVFGILLAFWSGLAGLTLIYPSFDGIYKLINTILGAAVGALLFAARGNTYVENRQPPPPNGKP